MPPERLNPLPHSVFLHPAMALPDLRPAREWRPGHGGLCGVRANAHIIATYQELDASLLRYLGGTPYSTWLTFARYATREVGSWIRGTESFLYAFGTRSASPAGQLRALQGFLASARADRILNIIGQTALRRLNSTGSSSLLVDARRLMSVGPWLTEVTWRVRSALVEANTELYHRLGFAFDLFLRAESEGRNGLEALGEAIADERLDDSLGFIRAGFARYRQTRELGPHVQGTPLEASRRQLIHEANVLLALQEQALILQRPTIFGHPVLHEVLGAVKPGLLLLTLYPESRDGSFHCFPLLPDGGNWADFASRMGFREVSPEDGSPPDAVAIRFPDRPAEQRLYVPDRSARGTILDLFTRYLEGPASEALRLGRPRDIRPMNAAA
ncbi:hypothetical protein JQX13_21580 [Archangium violaceum]|uniref:hypothetical protein n=1 Tax=Archangium violaceum TaxID=83451 RepID=UPI00193B948E|nr:hypothetical protein [Archangium violaceum]QRK12384.1 hypothetical protein JQX13_21580 [Archangium violaceum]